MKILFLCGCLEYGLDGVGDYTRRLAGELIREGHLIKLIAFNDKHVSTPTESIQESENTNVSIYRIPSILAEKERTELAFTVVDNFNPDWISLQYVLYSFHDKGLPFSLAWRLKKLGSGKKWHIMFHELWVGNETLKNIGISLLQKALIKNMLHQLQPNSVHTHLPIYFHQLQQLGQTANELPLFSNIPVSATIFEKKSNQFTIGFFSQAIASEKIFTFIKKIQQQLSPAGKKIQVLFIGGSEVKMKEIGNKLEEYISFSNSVKYTGYLSPEKISAYIQNCDLGITSLPLFTLGKSGSVAAFFAHKIPVAVPDSENPYSEFGKPFFNFEINKALLIDPDLSKFIDAKNAAIVAQKFTHLQTIAKKFLTDLNDATSNN